FFPRLFVGRLLRLLFLGRLRLFGFLGFGLFFLGFLVGGFLGFVVAGFGLRSLLFIRLAHLGFGLVLGRRARRGGGRCGGRRCGRRCRRFRSLGGLRSRFRGLRGL